MTLDQAETVIHEWIRETGTPPCERFLPGRWDITSGEHLCRNCNAPHLVHQAHRLTQGPHA